jgi:hypothetical protein
VLANVNEIMSTTTSPRSDAIRPPNDPSASSCVRSAITVSTDAQAGSAL